MKHLGFQFLVILSLTVAARSALADSRPRYGGTLHVAMQTALALLDPAERTEPDSIARRSLTSLLFETLVVTDATGRVQPWLSDRWEASRNHQHWQFHILAGVKFSDETSLTAEFSAASLRVSNPDWNVSVQGDEVIIDIDSPDPELAAEMALPHNAIAKRNGTGLVGTGPFHVTEWQPAKKLALAASENCWRGRPFLDAIEIEMGRNVRDQLTALDLGKDDLVEIAPEQVRRFPREKYSLLLSQPILLFALQFGHAATTPDDKLLRQALGLAIDRSSIGTVLLQGEGQPTAGLLPSWISGYGFVFPAQADLPKARQLIAQVRTPASWTLAYSGNDSLARTLSERISLNARDAGLAVQIASSSAAADMRLLAIPIASSNPWISLRKLLSTAGIADGDQQRGGSLEDLYHSEQSALSSVRLIPLFHLPVAYASSPRLKRAAIRPDGSWDLSDAWLEQARP